MEPLAEHEDTSLLDTRTLKRVGPGIGSNPAGVYEDKGGQRFYVKTLESRLHARTEWLAAMLYRLAGAPTLTYVKSADPCQIATVWQHLDKTQVMEFTAAELTQAQKWLGVHAWTANWDAAGFMGDNQGVSGGTVLTLDVGGSLQFRAQGYPKGPAFGTEVFELDTLRTRQSNPYAIELFSGMTNQDIRNSIAIVTELDEERIRQVILDSGGSEKLVDKMLARKADMAARLSHY